MEENDTEYRQRVFHKGVETEIPTEYRNRFTALLGEMEQATGEHFQLSFRMAGCEKDLSLNAFETRAPFLVSEMRPGYEGLNGVHASLQALRETVLRLKYGLSLDPGMETWTCPQCGQSRKEREGCKMINHATTHVFADVCRFCQHSSISIWNGFGVCLHSTIVYTSGRDPSSIGRPIGKITICPFAITCLFG